MFCLFRCDVENIRLNKALAASNKEICKLENENAELRKLLVDKDMQRKVSEERCRDENAALKRKVYEVSEELDIKQKELIIKLELFKKAMEAKELEMIEEIDKYESLERIHRIVKLENQNVSKN